MFPSPLAGLKPPPTCAGAAGVSLVRGPGTVPVHGLLSGPQSLRNHVPDPSDGRAAREREQELHDGQSEPAVTARNAAWAKKSTKQNKSQLQSRGAKSNPRAHRQHGTSTRGDAQTSANFFPFEPLVESRCAASPPPHCAMADMCCADTCTERTCHPLNTQQGKSFSSARVAFSLCGRETLARAGFVFTCRIYLEGTDPTRQIY